MLKEEKGRWMIKRWRWNKKNGWTDVNRAAERVWDEAAQKSSTSWDFLLALCLFLNVSSLTSFFSWTISLFFFFFYSSSPFSSSGGINFNDWFVSDPEDRGGRRRKDSQPSFCFCLFVSHTERLCGRTAQLHTNSGCFNLCVIHYVFDIIIVAKPQRQKRRQPRTELDKDPGRESMSAV